MIIGFDAKRLFHNYTGLGNYSRTLVKNLSALSCENQYLLFTKRASENRRTEYFFSAKNISIVSPIGFSPLWRTMGINRSLSKQGVELFHGLSAELPLGLNVPGVVTIHDLIFKTHPEQYSFIDRKIYSQKAKFACSSADKIIAISEATKKDILRFYDIKESKIEVIYQTCDDQFFEPVSSKQVDEIKEKYTLPDDFLLYVGSVIERKNLLKIVKSIESLGNQSPPLLCIGNSESSYGKQVKQYIEQNQLGERVRFINPEFKDFASIYKAATIFLYPSDYEGFGIPVIESLAVGTPVITSNLSSLPEAAGPDSLLLDIVNKQSLSEAILFLLSDAEKRNEMSRKGKEYVKRFKKEVVTQQLLNLYESISS